MAEDESTKKRGKRKGLGGLTPEKKKKLKVSVNYSHISYISQYYNITQFCKVG